MLWAVAFSSVPVHRNRDSQFQISPLLLHMRPTFLISNLAHEFRCYDVQHSKNNCCEVGRFNCSGYTLWNTERYDISVIQLGKTYEVEEVFPWKICT